jgi:hypothetical protein
MYSWQVLVQLEPQDPFVYPRLGKVCTVRLELLHCGFTVDHLFNRDYIIHTGHVKDSAMTLFLLRYSTVWGLDLLP